MNIRTFVAVAVVLASPPAGWGPAAAQILPTPPGWQIERAVLVSRHGVRSPTQSNAELDKHAATPWPTWPVEPGFLTPRGQELMRLMGTYYRVLYGGRGLVQADDCPRPGTVAAWADIDQRTRLSGAAILAGMYPRCSDFALRNQADFLVPDPLFHPQPSASCPMDPTANREAILKQAGGNLGSVQREYATQFTLMQSVLCPAGTTAAVGGGRCGLPAALSSLEAGSDGSMWIKGPIGIASTAAENFLMEAAEGLPKEQVAWGRLASDAALRDVLAIHEQDLNLTNRTKAIAQQKGSNLLSQVVATLQDGHKFPGMPVIAEPVRFALLMGHETNIASLAGLLDLNWQIPSFPANSASPGGALAFELFREVATGGRYVRLAYYAQTLAEMRNVQRLDYRDPPGMMSVDLPACADQAHEKACPLQRFVEIAKAAIDPKCVTVGTSN
jgi:4-phytase/acid phosphatase